MRRSWTASEEECLLNHIEFHKGFNGKWTEDIGKAIEEVKSELDAIKPLGAVLLTKQNIRDKIRGIARRVRERIGRFAKPRTIFLKGPVELKVRDKLNLGTKQTHPDITAKPTQAIQKPKIHENEHSQYRKEVTRKPQLEIQPAGSDTTSSRMSLPRLSPWNEPNGSRAKHHPSAPRRELLTEATAGIDCQTPAKRHPDCLRHTARLGSANQTEAVQGMIVLKDADSSTTLCRPEVQKDWPLKQKDASHSEEHGREPSSEEEWKTQIIGTFQRAFDVTGYCDSPVHAEIVVRMSNSYQHITDCVETLVESCDCRTIQYSSLAGDQAFLELAQILFPGHPAAHLIQKLNTAYSTHGTPLKDILRSFTAVALTRWPQKIFDDYKEQWNFSSQGAFGRRILHDAPDFHSKYSQLVYLDYLEEVVSDAIPNQASDLSTKFQALLANLVCGAKRSVRGSDSLYEPGISEHLQWQIRERAHDSFRTNITYLFCQHLRRHLEFEKSALWYTYIHPKMGDTFDRKTMKTDPDEPILHDRVVCLCLLPGIYSQEKTESGSGGKGEWKIISKAVVTLL